MRITIDASTDEGLQALQALSNLIDNSEPECDDEEIQFDPEGIMRLAGYGMIPSSDIETDVSEEETDETLNHDINKVNDGDSDGRGYKYGDDTYNLFGNENQKLRYVPARSGDNALSEKKFSDYFAEAQNKNG